MFQVFRVTYWGSPLLRISGIVSAVPAVLPLLSQKARYIYFAQMADDSEPIKSFEDFAKRLGQLVQAVYDGKLAGGFVDAMAALISRQITLAYREAWKEAGDDGPLPEYLTAAADDAIVNQFGFVDDYYKAIVDARVDGKPVDPLLTRVDGWAKQYDVSYKDGLQLINLENGGNLIWKKGATEHGCATCAALDGIILSAREWQSLDVHPRGYPNPKLECGGGGPVGNCDCELSPTDQRRSPKGYDSVLNIVTK